MIQFHAGTLKTTILSLNGVSVSYRKAAIRACKAAGRELHRRVKQNISLKTYTLSDLARLDHPYADRHGSIRIHRSGSKSILNPENRVHTQNGDLLDSLKHGFRKTNRIGYFVMLDTNVAPHAQDVVYGTKLMLPRNVLWDTAAAPFVQAKMMKKITYTLGKVLRSQAVIRFNP